MTLTAVCAKEGRPPLLATNNRCIQVTIHSAELQSHFVPVKTIQLFSVVFDVVRAVHKFHFRLVINETHNQMATSEKKVMQCYRLVFYTKSVHFLPTAVTTVKGLCSSRTDQLHSLE